MHSDISKKRVLAFHKKIFEWWNDNKRTFPWRETEDPYRIMVSEIMLQQTQASRVIEKYEEFLLKFPDVKSLAEASKTELLEIWLGLGYNRRALWLQETAQKIIELGEFPKSPKELRKLKGIGKYSANSILIFAFNENLATVDTNIRRILITEGFADEDTKEKELFQIAEKLVPKGKSRDWHNALMDYGAIYLTSSKSGIKPNSQQTKFDGSNREKRGKILRYLLENKNARFEELSKQENIPKKQLKNILERMQKEGLVSKEGEKFLIE